MSNLPTDVVIEYNGFTFPVETDIVGVTTTPVWDKAERTVVMLVHEWTVKTVIWVDAADDSVEGVDNPLDAIKTRLCRPACNLVLQNTAWGNFDINPVANQDDDEQPDTTGEFDLAWGPKPRLVSFKHLGYKYAAELTWKVSFALHPCQGTPAGKVLAWNYTLSFGKDRSGYTTRTYAGYVSIPMTRQSKDDRTLSANVDQLRDQIRPLLPIGFRRENENYDLSEDKRTMNFRVVDQQMPPNVPPEGVVDVQASHTARTSLMDIARSLQTLHATYEVTTARSRAEAWDHFALLLADRVSVAADQKLPLIIVDVHIGEPEIYGRKSAEFTVSYMLHHVSQRAQDAYNLLRGDARSKAIQTLLDSFLNNSGLWREATESDWSKWNESMDKDKVSTSRGTAGLAFRTSDDAIIDLCLGGAPKPPTSRSLTPKLPPGIRGEKLNVSTPPASDSFLDYGLAVEVAVRDSTLALDPLPTVPVQINTPKTNFADQEGYMPPYKGGPAPIIQYRTNPAVYVIVSGEALRAGYGITPPQLLSLGGQKAVPMNDASCFFFTWVAANYGVPIVAAQWRFRYRLAGLPRKPFLPPANPILGSVGTTQAQNGGSLGFIAQG